MIYFMFLLRVQVLLEVLTTVFKAFSSPACLMANLDSTFGGSEQMESTTAGKCVSSWSVLAFGIQFNKMPFFPWRQYKQFVEKPLMVGIGGFALQYFCNDLNNAVQKQGYGVITFVPYIVMLSIMLAVSILWWIIYGRRLESCQGLETLPRHRQDLEMNQTQQPPQENQRNEIPQAGDVQMDQALQGFFIRTEEFCSLMDCWFSTRLGEMTRDEALGKMKVLVEIGNRNRRSSDMSVESTADETRAVMNESLETSGDGSRRLSAGSIIDGTHNPVFPILCPGATNNQARSLSHDSLVLKIPQNVNVGELGEIYDANLPGCRELHKRIEIGPKDGHLNINFASQILGSLRKAWTLDKDSTIQLGSFAIFKYTESGLKCWMLQEGWTPTIFDIHRSSRNFFEVLTGGRANWTIRGVNLRDATLRVATAEKSENVTISHHFKTEKGVDVVLFKEPPSLPIFLDGVFISASKIVKVEEDVPLKLHSQAIKAQRAFWISVVDAFIPRPWTLGTMTILSLLLHYFVAWHFAMVLPIIVASYVYLLHNLVPQQGGDLPVGGSTPSNLGDSDRASSTKTLGQENSLIMDSSTDEQDGPLPSIQDLQIVGHAVLGERLTACGHSINGTTLCMFQWVRHYPDGTVVYIEGAAQPEYTVTADDHNTMLAVECVPMDERNRRGDLVNVFANESKLITCDEMLQNKIDRYNAIGYASFDVKFLVDDSPSEEYWESTLTLTRNSYKLKRINTAKIVISEECLSDASIQILVGHKSQCVIKSHKGRSYYLEFPSSRSRDVGVLTFRSFQKMALDGKQGSGKEAGTRNMQQTGESEESQCQSGDAKDEAFEVKKPQERVSTNKNKYVPQVWKLPELPKQDLTSPGSLRLTRISNLITPRLSLAKGGVVSGGGFSNSSEGVKTIGNPISAHTESTSQNDDIKDGGSTPPLEDYSSDSNSSTFELILMSPQEKKKKKKKRPSKKPMTHIIEVSPDQFRATVQELTGMNPAISVSRGQPVVDNPLHTDLITPGIGGLPPVVEDFSDVTNSNSRTIPSEGKLAEMDMPMGKQGGDLPVGAKKDVIELKSPQQHTATSKNKYVPQVRELSEPTEPTPMSRSGTRISDGDFPFEGRTQSPDAFSSIPARMLSQFAVAEDLTNTDKPIDKQPSRVSSPSAVEERFTTKDERIDKQGGGLRYKRWKEKKNLRDLQVPFERALREFKERGPTRTLELAKMVSLVQAEM